MPTRKRKRKCGASSGLCFPFCLPGNPRSSLYMSLPLMGSPSQRGKTQTKTAKKIKQLFHDKFSLSDAVHLLQLQFQLFFLPAGVASPRDMRKPRQLPQGISHGVIAVTWPSHRTRKGWELSQTKPSTLLTGEG